MNQHRACTIWGGLGFIKRHRVTLDVYHYSSVSQPGHVSHNYLRHFRLFLWFLHPVTDKKFRSMILSFLTGTQNEWNAPNVSVVIRITRQHQLLYPDILISVHPTRIRLPPPRLSVIPVLEISNQERKRSSQIQRRLLV